MIIIDNYLIPPISKEINEAIYILTWLKANRRCGNEKSLLNIVYRSFLGYVHL